jgi:hypothetical protein
MSSDLHRVVVSIPPAPAAKDGTAVSIDGVPVRNMVAVKASAAENTITITFRADVEVVGADAVP